MDSGFQYIASRLQVMTENVSNTCFFQSRIVFVTSVLVSGPAQSGLSWGMKVTLQLHDVEVGGLRGGSYQRGLMRLQLGLPAHCPCGRYVFISLVTIYISTQPPIMGYVDNHHLGGQQTTATP